MTLMCGDNISLADIMPDGSDNTFLVSVLSGFYIKEVYSRFQGQWSLIHQARAATGPGMMMLRAYIGLLWQPRHTPGLVPQDRAKVRALINLVY